MDKGRGGPPAQLGLTGPYKERKRGAGKQACQGATKWQEN